MKSLKVLAVPALAAGLVLAGCSDDDGDTGAAATTGTTATTEAEAPLPTAQDLNDVLARAVDPVLPRDRKLDTVEDGEKAPEIFDIMTASRQQSGASFAVLDPVLPGILPDTVSAPVTMAIPGREPQQIDGVEFLNEGGSWKLSRQWACTLVENVSPDAVPPLCAESSAAPAPDAPESPAPDAPAPDAPEAPAPDAPAPDAPAPEA
ncbi:hypothetical protein [Corynebacterium bovis]|uniref:hypothetical protein n=1 Tax=Corynebacterium bovis TaxID=36808 RepID=UPI00313A0FBC